MPWDGKKLPDALAIAATAAANAAADGSKNVAYLTYLQGQIGSNFLMKLVREDVTVWQATASGSLSISDSRFVLPTSLTQNSITAADIDSGQWILRVENATDPTKYMATAVTPSGGLGPFRLSSDLSAGGAVAIESLFLNSPSFDTISTTFPIPAPTRQQLRDNMLLPHENTFIVGDGSDGSGAFPGWGPVVNGGQVQVLLSTLNRLLPWYVIAPGAGGHTGTISGVRIQTGQLEMWVRNNGSWVKHNYSGLPEGGLYLFPVLSTSIDAVQDTATVSGQSVRETDIPPSPPNYRGYHTWGGFFNGVSSSSVSGLVVRSAVRLIGANAGNANVVGYCGCDQYTPSTDTTQVVTAYGHGNTMQLTTSWKWLTFCHVPGMTRSDSNAVSTSDADLILTAVLPADMF